MKLTIRNLLVSFGLAALALIAGCATGVQSAADSQPLDKDAKWALLPLTNHTDTPQAALAAEAQIEHQLRFRGINKLLQYPADMTSDTLFEPTDRKVSQTALKWARDQGAVYGLTGAVQEWRYKVGIDGEPAAGVSLQIIELESGNVVWSASGAKAGWSRQALSAVSQTLLSDMLDTLKLRSGK